MSKILVIGDTCKDVFIYGHCKRLCPEAPVPVFNPTNEKWNRGMAGNVFANVNALNRGDGISRLIVDESNTTKTRYVDIMSNQMIMRYDQNDKKERIDWNKRGNSIGNGWDAIIISDYNKGFLEISDIEHICDIAKTSNIPVFLDTKKNLSVIDMDYLKNVFCFKINEKEYSENETFLRGYYKGHVIVTRGSEGATHYEMNMGGNNNGTTYPLTQKAEVRDLSGAGDTFIAGLVVEYCKGKDFSEAIKYANKCASYVVTQKGVVVVDKSKIE